MLARGDDLRSPRIIEFNQLFDDREHALGFITSLDDKDFELCLSWYSDRGVWQVIIKVFLTPAYDVISTLEENLAKGLGLFNGTPEGWNCMPIPARK